MMSSASVALPAPLTPEPVLEAIRSLARAEERQPEPARAASATASATTVPVTRAVTWVEPTENLWLLSIKNFGLALGTFGVYHFWGRAEMNRQVVNAIHVNGKPLDFSGTGREAFTSFAVGALIAITIVSVFVSLFILGPGGGANSATVAGIREFRWQRLTISLPLLFLFGSIAYRKRHHILRRSWLAGARFRQTGHAWSYAWLHFWSTFTVPLTLGWAAPWRASKLSARKINEMEHDSGMRFHAKPELKALYKTFALVWFGGGLLYVATLVVLAQYIGPELLAAIRGLTLEPLKSWAVVSAAAKVIAVAAIPLLAILFLWRKAWLEHQLSSVAFEGGRVRLQMPVSGYLYHAFSGLFLTLLSFGCFNPVARARFMQFVVDHLTIEGQLKIDSPRC